MLVDVRSYLKKPIVRYILAGGTSYLIELASILAINKVTGNTLLAVGISFWVGLIVSFLFQKYAFKSKTVSIRHLTTEAIAYLLLVAINYAFTLWFVEMLQRPLGGLIVARTIALAITTIWNYVIYQKIIFRERPANHHAEKIAGTMKTRKELLATIVLCFSLCVLAASTVYVSYKSAQAHIYNHDQVINGLMFKDVETFKDAVFPGAHTQLVKWPVFALLGSFDNKPMVFLVVTVVLYSAMVATFAYALYRVLRRDRLATALTILMLSNTLFLVPVQPSPGALLPVGAAMITTRNIEYILYLLLVFFFIARSDSRRWAVSGMIVLGVALGASDSLFAALPLLTFVAYSLFDIALSRKKSHLRSHVRLGVIGITIYIGSVLLLKLIDALHITHVPGASTSSPYPFIHSLNELPLALSGFLKAMLFNFGAWPNYHLGSRLYEVPYYLNILLLIIGIASGVYVVWRWVTVRLRDSKRDPLPETLFALIVSSLGTIALFVLTRHEYKSDARYISIVYFALVLAIAYVIHRERRRFSYRRILTGIVIMIIILPLTALAARETLNHTVHETKLAIGDRMQAADSILEKNKVKVLVGDYWFTVPTKVQADTVTTVVPMSTDRCEMLNIYLTSMEWYPAQPAQSPTAIYLLRDAGDNATTFNHGCTLQFLDNKYGAPSAQYILRGDNSRPIDILRIYNYDVRTKITK